MKFHPHRSSPLKGEEFYKGIRRSLNPLDHWEGANRFFDLYQVSEGGDQFSLVKALLAEFAHLPYENLSKIIKLHRAGPEVRLPLEVVEDHKALGLGGTCFSLTFLLQAILKRWGLPSYPVMADMKVGRNAHCCLVVKIGQRKYLLDPGYLLHLPLELSPHEGRIADVGFSSVELRFDPGNGYYNLFTLNQGERRWRYRFKDLPTPMGDFQRHWRSSFGWRGMKGIFLTRATVEGLFYLHNDFMRRTSHQGKRDYRLKGQSRVIEEVFGIKREVIEEAKEILRGRREGGDVPARSG